MSPGNGIEQDPRITALVERLGVGPTLTGGILLVDDEPFNLRVLRDLLEGRWTVHQASSGEEALAVAVAGAVPLDVVVADQRMPGMSGVDLLAELRTRRPDVAGIVITAFADMQALESAINRAQAFRFLRKPWEPPDVLQAIEQAGDFVAQRRTIGRLVELLARREEELRGSLDRLRSQQETLLHLERVSTLGRLASGIAHDLRNVLIGLRAAEGELQQLDVARDLREFLGLGLAQVDGLLHTLQTLREYSRGGTLELALGTVEPGRLVDDAVAISRMDLAFRRRRVDVVAPRDLPPLQADRQKLTQVLVNLIRNALQATRDGGAVGVRAGILPGGEVELVVEDDGPGVPPSLRERLFEPFASGKGELGLGMGLYMARLVVERHGGRIAATRGALGGARFEVALPVAGDGARGARGAGDGEGGDDGEGRSS